jgi:hypothetical protein
MRTALFTLAALAITTLASGQGQGSAKYPLTEREGPWLVHVGSFRGDDALNYANNLAEEVRSKHRLLTFVFAMEDMAARQEADALRKAQVQHIGSEKVAESDEKIKLRTVRVAKDYSVFVGSFKDMKEAREQAAVIKEFPPPASIPAYGLHFYNAPTETVQADPESLGAFTLRRPTGETKGVQRTKPMQGNPFRQAFVCRNPLVVQARPTVQQQTNSFDPKWRALNAREKYSVFTCPKPWTLVVATFRPPTEVLGAGRDVFQANYSAQAYGHRLEVCAEQARRLAELLRDGGKGYDAYVFHEAECSHVTVGAFESRTDENMEKAYYALAEFAKSQPKTSNFSCMTIPVPMQIPGK